MTKPQKVREDLEKGEVVEYSYKPEDAEDPTETRTVRGTVCKSNRGGIRILPEQSRRSIHVIKAASVIRKHRDGGAARLSSRIGGDADVERTGETRSVTYKQGTGWVHTEEAEEA